ncbi:MAG: SPOR domain-containing protein [Desulfobacteraceae bacterium]|jgi:hypothetical protein
MPRKIIKYQIDEKKYFDTSEIFDSLFGKALRILFRKENQEEEAEKYEKKGRSKRKKSKSASKEKAPKGAEPEAEGKPNGIKTKPLPKGVTSVTEEISGGVEKQRRLKGVRSGKDKKSRRTKTGEAPEAVIFETGEDPSGAESLERLKQDEPRNDGSLHKDKDKTGQSPIKYERAEKAKFKPIVEAKKSRRRRRMSKRQPNVGSSKRRTLLAFILLLALAGAYFYYQSGGDLGKLAESMKSIKKDAIPVSKDIAKIITSLPSKIKGIIQPEEAKKVAQKPARKPPQVARKPVPKNEISPPPKEAAPQKNLLIVKKPSAPVAKETQRPAPRQSYRRAVKQTPRPVPKQPYIPAAGQSPEPAAEVTRPPAVKEPPKVVAHTNKPKVPNKASTLPAKPPVSYPYSVYLGSYSSLKRAEKAVSMYEKKGLSPYWVEVDLGEKGVWFRIFTGYFPSKEQAEAYIDKNQLADASPRRTAYANLIGVFQSQYELNRKKVTLSKLGYSPYVIAGINGESLLYAGAFYQKARAEKQHMRLASNGIRNRVVVR